MTEKTSIRERLLKEREQVAKEISGLEEDLAISVEDASGESPNDQHMAETATATLDREIDVTLRDQARATLAKIDRALAKLEEGSYGRCDNCEKEIGEGRLEIAPYSTLCVECKRLEERER